MNWDVIVAANDRSVLEGCLLSSPAIHQAHQLMVQWGFAAAARAYNDGLKKTSSEVVVFAHQDVYLPMGWDKWLTSSLEWLSANDSAWAVAGVFGIGIDDQFKGQVYCTRNKRVVGTPLCEPVQALALDELLLIVRRSAEIHFDERLPGFHLYGTDICLEARRRALHSYVVPAFCIHNSSGWVFLPWAFWRSYFYLRRKWWNQLPLKTPCTVIQRKATPVITTPAMSFYHHCLRRRPVGMRVNEPAKLFETILRSGQLSLKACGPQVPFNPPSHVSR